jgi:hypothetical protein
LATIPGTVGSGCGTPYCEPPVGTTAGPGVTVGAGVASVLVPPVVAVADVPPLVVVVDEELWAIAVPHGTTATKPTSIDVKRIRDRTVGNPLS